MPRFAFVVKAACENELKKQKRSFHFLKVVRGGTCDVSLLKAARERVASKPDRRSNAYVQKLRVRSRGAPWRPKHPRHPRLPQPATQLRVRPEIGIEQLLLKYGISHLSMHLDRLMGSIRCYL